MQSKDGNYKTMPVLGMVKKSKLEKPEGEPKCGWCGEIVKEGVWMEGNYHLDHIAGYMHEGCYWEFVG